MFLNDVIRVSISILLYEYVNNLKIISFDQHLWLLKREVIKSPELLAYNINILLCFMRTCLSILDNFCLFYPVSSIPPQKTSQTSSFMTPL